MSTPTCDRRTIGAAVEGAGTETDGRRATLPPLRGVSGDDTLTGTAQDAPATTAPLFTRGSVGRDSAWHAPDADLDRLLVVLPPRIRDALARALDAGGEIVELALDLGRPLVARSVTGHVVIDPAPFSQPELEAIIGQVGMFRRNNRTGIDGTLHRLSLVRDRFRTPVGVTIRIGRHLTGVAEAIRDLLLDGRRSLLLIGPPGAGKTTLLRDCARLLSERLGPGIIVVDSHNEIGGDGKIPHPAIGAARRLQVPDGCDQYEIMLEAIRNHYPQVVMVDEVTTRQEADVARTISRRGVRLIATAHGETLADIVHDPELCWLVGGAVQTSPHTGSVTSPFGRAEPPTMETALELKRDRTVAIYPRVDRAVDALYARTGCDPGEPRPVPVAFQQRPKPAPEPARTHELIPDSDPWGLAPNGECSIKPAIGFLYLLSRDIQGTLHLQTATGNLSLDRSAPLPLDELCAAAGAGDFFMLDPWVTLPTNARAVLALWSFTTSPETRLDSLPDDLRPQAIIRSAFGRALVWIPVSPYPEEPPEGLPDLSVFLSEIALALNVIPAGPGDAIPLPRQEADLEMLSSTRRTDPRALWEWAHAASRDTRDALRGARR
jgi:stage III sporulation protein SpoIIIAA